MSYPSFDVDKKYTVMQNIGKGSAGSVFMCKSKRDHKTYALKQIFLDKRKKSRNKDTVLREVISSSLLQTLPGY
jgi:serine/threonine protein kinase